MVANCGYLRAGKTAAEANKEPDMDTSFALTLVGGAMDTLFMVTPGLKAQMQWYQNTIAGVADSLEVCAAGSPLLHIEKCMSINVHRLAIYALACVA